MRLKHVHIIGRVSICVVLVAALVSCQPLSSKRTTGNSSRKQSKTDSTTVKPDLPEGTGNPFTAVTPIDSSTLRRKIPTLREQMEKLQMQQDYTNAKLDSLRAEIATVKAAVAQREESPKQQPASSKTLSPKQQKQNEAAPVVTDLRGEKPGAQKKEQPKKIKQDLPPDEEPTITQQKPKSAKNDNNLILPDGAMENESEPRQQKENPPVTPTKKKPAKSDVIMPDEPAVAKKSPAKKNIEPDINEAAPVSEKKTSKPTARKIEPVRESENIEQPVESPPQKQPAAVVANPVQNGVSYNTALTLFAKKQYTEAIGLLSDVAAKEKDPNTIGNCYYWMGESYYGLGKYDDAVKSFEKVLQVKSSAKSDDALAMIGETYSRQGNTAEAKKAYQKLIAQFPQSDNIPKAKKRLQQL